MGGMRLVHVGLIQTIENFQSLGKAVGWPCSIYSQLVKPCELFF